MGVHARQTATSVAHLLSALVVASFFVVTWIIRSWPQTYPTVHSDSVPFMIGDKLYKLFNGPPVVLDFSSTAPNNNTFSNLYPPALNPVCTPTGVNDVCRPLASGFFFILQDVLQYSEAYHGACVWFGLLVGIALGVMFIAQTIQLALSMVPSGEPSGNPGETTRMLDAITSDSIGANPLRYLEAIALDGLLYTIGFSAIGINESASLGFLLMVVIMSNTLLMMSEMQLRLFSNVSVSYDTDSVSKKTRYSFSIWTVFFAAFVQKTYIVFVVAFQSANNFYRVSSNLTNIGNFAEAAPVTTILGFALAVVLQYLIELGTYGYGTYACATSYLENGKENVSVPQTIKWNKVGMSLVHIFCTLGRMIFVSIFFAMYMTIIQNTSSASTPPTC